MNRIAITSILFCCVFFTSGCFEVGYKTEVKLTLGRKKEPAPEIVDNGYPTLPVSLVEKEPLKVYRQEISDEPRRRGFKKFRQEK
jgi:hypothetical protein